MAKISCISTHESVGTLFPFNLPTTPRMELRSGVEPRASRSCDRDGKLYECGGREPSLTLALFGGLTTSLAAVGAWQEALHRM